MKHFRVVLSELSQLLRV